MYNNLLLPNNMIVFGHRHLSFFFKTVVQVDESGFVFRGKNYEHGDIVNIKVTESPSLALFMYPSGMPEARIKLVDGAVIRLNGRVLERNDQKAEAGFLNNRSTAFDQLIAYFRKGTECEIPDPDHR